MPDYSHMQLYHTFVGYVMEKCFVKHCNALNFQMLSFNGLDFEKDRNIENIRAIGPK